VVLKMHKAAAPQAQVSAPVAKAAAAPVATYKHVACPANAVIAAADREDGLARMKGEPTTQADIDGLILSGKESAAAGRPRDAELIFLAVCKAADQMQRETTGPTDSRYQLARHYAHYLQVGNPPPATRAELLGRAELLYTDSVQAYRARYGAEHEKTRFANEGLTALRQSQPQPQAMAQAAPAATMTKAVAPPAAVPKAVAVKTIAIPVEARPRHVVRAPAAEAEVIEAPVRQATGTAQ
jgi:hypothetical protein